MIYQFTVVVKTSEREFERSGYVDAPSFVSATEKVAAYFNVDNPLSVEVRDLNLMPNHVVIIPA